MQCTNCGGEIKNGATVCEFCGTPITSTMRREQEKANMAGCPKCGSSNITFNREQQGTVHGKNNTVYVRSTIGMCKDCGYTWDATRQSSNSDEAMETKPKRKTWLWVLGWICIFPVPLTILMLRNKNMKPALKYGIIAAAWIVYLIIGIAGNNQDNAKTETTTSVEQSVDATSQTTGTTFTITPGDKGEYGSENTLNKGTDQEETKIVYHIPAGNYTVKNLGDNTAQVSAYSDKTTKNGDYEEPSKTGDVILLDADASSTFSIEDGYYVEINGDGNLEFTKSE